jgi:molybdenum cofactor cytidylyltransferase
MKIAGLILAAGFSSRLGHPKQLLKLEENTLLQHSILTAIKAGLDPLYVVLGYSFDAISNSIQHLPVNVIYNQGWDEGMASSIRAGINKIEKDSFDAVLIMLCDQKRITNKHLENLIKEFYRSDKSIIATSYSGQSGVPVLFDKKFFPSLKSLRGDSGGKKIIETNSDSVFSVKFEDASADIDSPGDITASF